VSCCAQRSRLWQGEEACNTLQAPEIGSLALPNQVEWVNLPFLEVEIVNAIDREKSDWQKILRRSFKACTMPLVIFSGLPCSGKTTRAFQLKEALELKIASLGRKFNVHVINDDTLGINREVYRGLSRFLPCLTLDAKSEKAARGTFYSAIQRVLSKDDIVIADGMNYIKGFRYQLFCEAKALSTPHCVVVPLYPFSKYARFKRGRRHPYVRNGTRLIQLHTLNKFFQNYCYDMKSQISRRDGIVLYSWSFMTMWSYLSTKYGMSSLAQKQSRI
jgi:hypothetical protein